MSTNALGSLVFCIVSPDGSTVEPYNGETKSLDPKTEGNDTKGCVTTEQTESSGVTTTGISKSPDSINNQASDADVEGVIYVRCCNYT